MAFIRRSLLSRFYDRRPVLLTAIALLATSMDSPSAFSVETPVTYYVRSDAQNGGDGLSWTTAFRVLPRPLLRGATYYIGDGHYASYRFDTPPSGDQRITIRKATALDHGTNDGWISDYGDGTADWEPIEFASSYWVFDGASGGGPGAWTTGHGFRFVAPSGAEFNFLVLAEGTSHVTVRRTAFYQTGDYHNPKGVNAIYNATHTSHNVLEYLFIDNLSGLPFMLRGGTGNVIQWNYTGRICGVSIYGDHCASIVIHSMSDLHFRWNYVAESPSSGGLVKNNTPRSDDVRIYGNVFRRGFPINCNRGECLNWRIFNNTFVSDLRGGPVGGSGTYTGLRYYNNLTFDATTVQRLLGEHGHNWFSNVDSNSCTMNPVHTENICPSCSGSCDRITETANPFQNIAADTPEGLHLVTALAAWPGINVCSFEVCDGINQYHLDMFGQSRLSSVGWTRGAVQYQAASARPAVPVGVRIIGRGGA